MNEHQETIPIESFKDIYQTDLKNYYALTTEENQQVKYVISRLLVPIKIISKYKIILYPNQAGEILLLSGDTFISNNCDSVWLFWYYEEDMLKSYKLSDQGFEKEKTIKPNAVKKVIDLNLPIERGGHGVPEYHMPFLYIPGKKAGNQLQTKVQAYSPPLSQTERMRSLNYKTFLSLAYKLDRIGDFDVFL